MTKAFELFKESLEKISDEDFAKILDEMENKELKIEVPQGYEIDKENSTFEKIVFKKVEKELPKCWEELGEIKGWYVDSFSDIMPCDKGDTDKDNDKNIFPTIEEAEACLALAQLCQLRDRYNDGWKPDWENRAQNKFIIYIHPNNKILFDKISANTHAISRHLLTFKTEELRNKFLENFEDLIKIAKPLL